jgi:putative endonuclease
MKFYYVYILQSQKDKYWYTGYTSNLRKRFSEHQNGYTHSTKSRRPWRLIYYEACLSEGDAIAREKYLKSGMGKRFIKKRLKLYLAS